VRRLACLVGVVFFALAIPPRAVAQNRVLTIAYTPTKRAQVAIWIEDASGTFLTTILLTEAVGLRGIGNRPGALQMNSGFRWPYGRREGVLPVWAHRRAAAPGAMLFPRVIFQNRWEGYASRSSRTPGVSGEDSSPDSYFCLSFDDANNDDVDATTCASVFNSDKGRFITQDDLDAGYAEPWQDSPGVTVERPLSLMSLYPMRRDAIGGVGHDGPDSTELASVARSVMPDIDAVTRATSPGDAGQLIAFPIPDAWPNGEYVVFVEVNTERDYNGTYESSLYPTPEPLEKSWDSWSTFGYPYRGQPSLVYRVPIHVSAVETVAAALTPSGYGDLHGLSGDLHPIDASITDDSTNARGSGADRLQAGCGERVRVSVGVCDRTPVVSPVVDFVATRVDDEAHSHEFGALRFTAVDVEGADPLGYQIKVSTLPITNETEFVQAEDAKATTLDYQGLDLCPVRTTESSCDAAPLCPHDGTPVDVQIGKLQFLTHYYVAVRAIGPCGATGPIATSEFETTEIHFTTVAPCFVATAAFGSPMAHEVSSLRRFRDQRLVRTGLGRRLVGAYYEVGPALAKVVRDHAMLRAVTRTILRPFVHLGRFN